MSENISIANEHKPDVISIRESDGSIVKLEVHDTLRSTTRTAREYAAAGYPDRYAVFSRRKVKKIPKSEGKEQMTETQNGVFLSILLRPSLFPSQASLLGALAGTALITALDEHTDQHLGIGWVSDIYCNGERIGNASVEGKLDSFNSYEYIIVSFAVKTDQKNFPPRLTDMMRKVFESENTSIEMIIARSIINKFFKFYPSLKVDPKFMNLYSRRFILRGKRVKLQTDQKRIRCKILNVETKTGALVLEKRGGEIIHATSPKQVSLPKRVRVRKGSQD